MKLKALLGASALAVTLPAGGAVFAQEEMPACENCSDAMVIMSWGGAYQSSQLRAYVEPYVAATGITVTWDESSNEAVAKLRAAQEAGNMPFDLVDVEGPDAQRACDEGLAIEIDIDEALTPAPDGTPASEDFGESRVNDCYIPQIVFSTTFGYRTDVAAWNGATPDDICDIFDLETFPGMRSLQQSPKKNLEWALVCDGVAAEDVYDVLSEEGGVERALAKLDTIRDSVIWWTAGAETPQRLADGEAVIGSTYNGRLFSVIAEEAQPVAMLWDHQVFDYDGWIVPAGLDEARLNRVMHFLRFSSDTQRLADQAKYIAYGPARASSQPLVSTHVDLGIEMAPFMPTNPANMQTYIVNSIDWWADNQDEVEATFQNWLAQ
jgi:putative spermidine/putrescine transport system substrate-binding protein